MKILGNYAYKIYVNKISKTLHYTSERNDRDKFISDNNLYACDILDTFIVDKDHYNGLELHCVTDTGLIIILNKHKYELSIPCHITTLIARPSQISRYYKNEEEIPMEALLASLKNRIGKVDNNIF